MYTKYVLSSAVLNSPLAFVHVFVYALIFCGQYAVYHRIFSFLINKHHLRKLFDINVKTKKMHLFVLQFGNEAKIVPQIEM